MAPTSLFILLITCNIRAETIVCNSATSLCHCATDGPCIIECLEQDGCKSRSSLRCHPDYPCTIHCHSQTACKQATLYGPVSNNFNVSCMGQDACADSVIVDTNATDVTISCSQKNGCKNLVVPCGSGDCSFTCEAQKDACVGMNIATNNATSVTCDGAFCDAAVFSEITYTAFPTQSPTTLSPTNIPTITPTFVPTVSPTVLPTLSPTPQPSPEPTWTTTQFTSSSPLTLLPSDTYDPTVSPSDAPVSIPPTSSPSNTPTPFPLTSAPSDATTSTTITREISSTTTHTSMLSTSINNRTQYETTMTQFTPIFDIATTDGTISEGKDKRIGILFGSALGVFNLLMCVCIGCGIWYCLRKHNRSKHIKQFEDVNNQKIHVSMVEDHDLVSHHIQLEVEDCEVIRGPHALQQHVSSYSDKDDTEGIIMGGYTVEGMDIELASNYSNDTNYKKAMHAIDALIMAPKQNVKDGLRDNGVENTNGMLIQEDSVDSTTDSSQMDGADEKQDIVDDIKSIAAQVRFDPEVIADEDVDAVTKQAHDKDERQKDHEDSFKDVVDYMQTKEGDINDGFEQNLSNAAFISDIVMDDIINNMETGTNAEK